MVVAVYHDEASRLRKLANSPHVVLAFSFHAEREMRKDGIDRPDISSMLKRCAVARCEAHGLEWRLTAWGRDFDGRRIEAIVVADEERERIDIVSAWAIK